MKLMQITPECTFVVADMSGSQFNESEVFSEESSKKRKKKKKKEVKAEKTLEDRNSIIEEMNKKSSVPSALKFFVIFITLYLLIISILNILSYLYELNAIQAYYECVNISDFSTTVIAALMNYRVSLRFCTEYNKYSKVGGHL